MKSLILAFVFIAGIASASAQTTSCENLTYRHTSLCTWPDKHGTLTDYQEDGSFRSTDFPPEEWAKLYTQLMSEDLAKTQAHIKELDAQMEKSKQESAALEAHMAANRTAMSIQSKKKCVAAGFTWGSGLCSAPSQQPPQ